jgi:hypothetical protein
MLSEQVVYPNIGSGTICKLFWDTPVALNNAVQQYRLTLTYDFKTDSSSNGEASSSTLTIDKIIGNVNEFYITSDMISISTSEIRASLTAISTYGSSYDGVVGKCAIRVAPSTGMYIEVSTGYTRPIMKRAVALARVSDPSEDSGLLMSSDGYELLTLDSLLLAEDVLIWSIMKDFYTKDSQGSWKPSDIRYEILTDVNGDPITTDTDEFIYLE